MTGEKETTLSVRTVEEMREVMMLPGVLTCRRKEPLVKDAYYVIHFPGRNITILPEYRLGQEYPKTYGHIHKPSAEETYEVLLGDAAMLLQRGIYSVNEVKLVRLKRGDSITVPADYAHILINLGKGPVVTIDDHDPAKYANEYSPIREMRGFSYYLVEDSEGNLKAVLNPRYKRVPSLSIVGNG